MLNFVWLLGLKFAGLERNRDRTNGKFEQLAKASIRSSWSGLIYG